MNNNSQLLIYQSPSGDIKLDVRLESETVWLTQKLMGVLFEVSVATINEHLANIFKTGEATESATVRKFRIVQTEGTRQDCQKQENSVCLDFRHTLQKITRTFSKYTFCTYC
jgi:hypothetical protein